MHSLFRATSVLNCATVSSLPCRSCVQSRALWLAHSKLHSTPRTTLRSSFIRYRGVQQSAPPTQTSGSAQPTPPGPTAPAPAAKETQGVTPATSDSEHISIAEQRRKDWSIVKRLAENIWPKGDWTTRSRVILGFGLLIGGKVRPYIASRRPCSSTNNLC